MSKLLIGETKNDFDHEYITRNSLIYNTDDAWHRVSLRYIGKGFPNDMKKNFWKPVEKSENIKTGTLHEKMRMLRRVRIKKAKSENRAAFRLRFISWERCLLCC